MYKQRMGELTQQTGVGLGTVICTVGVASEGIHDLFMTFMTCYT